jgi:hypothetical protein
MHSESNKFNLWTIEEVAELFDRKPRSIQRWVKLERIPQPFRPAGHRGKPYWRERDLEDFIEAGGMEAYHRNRRRRAG